MTARQKLDAIIGRYELNALAAALLWATLEAALRLGLPRESVSEGLVMIARLALIAPERAGEFVEHGMELFDLRRPELIP